MVALERYHWPGNVRELQNVVERAVLLGKEPMITRGRPAGRRPRRDERHGHVARPASGRSRKRSKARSGRSFSTCSNRTAGTATLTADQLGINRTTLYKKMKRLGLEDGHPLSI